MTLNKRFGWWDIIQNNRPDLVEQLPMRSRWSSGTWMINSMEPSDAIRRHGSWSTLAQVIACCLTAPSNYLNQCWGTYDIHLRAIPQEIPHPPNTNYKLAWKLLIYICFQIHQGPIMMTSSNGNIFRVTGHLCRKFTGDRWIPRTKASDAELWCFLWSAPE